MSKEVTKKKLSKQTKGLLKATSRLTIENYFENKTPEEVYKEYSAEILEFMKNKIKGAFEVVTADQMEMGEYSSEARATEFDGVVYCGTRLDIKVRALGSKKSKSLIFVFTPFTVRYFGVRKEFSDLGEVDKELTLALRKNMKKEFGEVEYAKALRKYNRKVKVFKDQLASGEVSL